MNKKKILIITTALIMLLSVSGCAFGGGTSDLTDKIQNTSAEEKKPQKTAAELAQTVLDSVEFPQTVEVTDKEMIENIGIDLSLTEDFSVYQQMLSVDVVEVVILKVKDGEMETVLASLRHRKESLINDFACYPGQVESAEATVVGSKGNIAYLICHKDADTAESKLLEAIDA